MLAEPRWASLSNKGFPSAWIGAILHHNPASTLWTPPPHCLSGGLFSSPFWAALAGLYPSLVFCPLLGVPRVIQAAECFGADATRGPQHPSSGAGAQLANRKCEMLSLLLF